MPYVKLVRSYVPSYENSRPQLHIFNSEKTIDSSTDFNLSYFPVMCGNSIPVANYSPRIRKQHVHMMDLNDSATWPKTYQVCNRCWQKNLKTKALYAVVKQNENT